MEVQSDAIRWASCLACSCCKSRMRLRNFLRRLIRLGFWGSDDRGACRFLPSANARSKRIVLRRSWPQHLNLPTPPLHRLDDALALLGLEHQILHAPRFTEASPFSLILVQMAASGLELEFDGDAASPEAVEIGLAFDAGSYFSGSDADFEDVAAEQAEVGDALRGEEEEGGLEFEGF